MVVHTFWFLMFVPEFVFTLSNLCVVAVVGLNYVQASLLKTIHLRTFFHKKVQIATNDKIDAFGILTHCFS